MIFSGEYSIPPAIKEKKASDKNELNLVGGGKEERYLKTDFTIKINLECQL